MHCLIRRITRKSRSGVGHTDDTVEAGTLTIGRATDQHVFLPDLHVALRHAVIRPVSDGRFSVQARTPSGVQINGRTVQTGTARVGDTLSVGRTELRLLEPPEGMDLALEIDEAPAREGRPLDVGALSLAETRLGKRRWAWALFVLILAFGIAIPFAEIELGDGGRAAVASITGETDGGDAGGLPWHVLGGDLLWDSGPLSRAHRVFGRECGACHREPFQRVTDRACLQCHRNQPHHADAPELMRAVGLDDQRCARCHREHKGRDGLIATATEVCTGCHAEPGRNMAQSELDAVTGFGAGTHPQFRVRLVALADSGQFEWQRVRMGRDLSEDNGLFFPHARHLASEGIEAPEGKEVLACASCHRPGPDRAAMQPIRFARDCQRCHRLDFEPNDPTRQLPHGEPDAVVAMLQEYYSRVALAGGYRNADADPPEIVRRRRPGGDELDEDQRQVALRWAQQWAATVADEVFEYRACGTCHTIERRPDSEAGWRVRPVAMTQNWFPAHRFSHEPHLEMRCTSCHAAGDSERARDVLMPGIDNCLQCHGEEGSSSQVASRCVDCHGFHAADELTMGHDTVAAGVE